jgi:hypothetical protein
MPPQEVLALILGPYEYRFLASVIKIMNLKIGRLSRWILDNQTLFVVAFLLAYTKLHTVRGLIMTLPYMHAMYFIILTLSISLSYSLYFLPISLPFHLSSSLSFTIFLKIIHLFTCAYIVCVISSPSPSPSPTPCSSPHFQADPVLPLSLILLKKRHKHNKEDKAFLLLKDSYTERLPALLSCTNVLHPKLIHL